MRAACAVHERERFLRHFITEMFRASDVLVLRLQLLGYARMQDGVLAYAVQLRSRLAAEAGRAPLLHRWQRTFEALERESRGLDPLLDEHLARDLAAWGLPEEPSHQLPLGFTAR